MSKKTLLFIGLFLLVIGLYLILKSQAPHNKQDALKAFPKVSTDSNKPQRPTPSSSPKKQDPTQAKQTPAELVQSLNDRKLAPQERVYKIRDLDLSPETEAGRQNIEGLVVFINSENELLNDPETQEPHSYKGIQLQKEASLRVYAIKRINELSYSQAKPYLEKVITEGKDKALIRIAKQVLEHKAKGEDYYENLKKGIRQMDTGIHDQNDSETSDHSDHGH